MIEIFYNKYGRIRSGWRFIVFLLVFIPVFAVTGAAAGFLFSSLPIGFSENALLARIIGSTLGIAVAVLLGWFCGKIFEGLPFRALGASFTKYWLKDLAGGILAGTLTLIVAVLIAVVFGGLSFKYNDSAGSTAILITLLMTLFIFVLGAAFEEVLVRGYIFQTLTRADLSWLAIILTSLFFASGHLGNPGSNVFSTINTALAGVWLGVAYLKTRTLWLVFGIHFAWNWVMGSFFGIEVSGLKELVPAPFLMEIDNGPVWITGGNYGLEGGIACTAALVISTIAIWYLPVFKPSEEMLELTSAEIPDEQFLARHSNQSSI
ncbi:MAG: type II CAAX endopeptidase family protein [Pyrinomonadaceae bacterium]